MPSFRLVYFGLGYDAGHVRGQPHQILDNALPSAEMTESSGGGEDELLQPPQYLFERLAKLKGYTWDQSLEPFHSAGHEI